MGIDGIIVVVCSAVVLLITISVVLYIIYATKNEKAEATLHSYLGKPFKNLTERVSALEKSNSKDKE